MLLFRFSGGKFRQLHPTAEPSPKPAQEATLAINVEGDGRAKLRLQIVYIRSSDDVISAGVMRAFWASHAQLAPTFLG
jgi:hypothetical protein